MTELEWLEIFGDNLKSMMDEYGYNQQDLAKAIKVSQSTISRYISEDVRRRQMPTVKTVMNIAYVLDCSVSELIDFDDKIED